MVVCLDFGKGGFAGTKRKGAIARFRRRNKVVGYKIYAFHRCFVKIFPRLGRTLSSASPSKLLKNLSKDNRHQ